MFDPHFCQRHSSTSVHLHRKRRVAGAAPEPVSRRRGADVMQEEPGSSADERVLAPRSALRDLKRVKRPSILAFEVCPQLPACQPAWVAAFVRDWCLFPASAAEFTWQVSRRRTPPRERTCPMGKTQMLFRSEYGATFILLCANKLSVKN